MTQIEALLLSVLIESVVLALLLSRQSMPMHKLICITALPTLLTHPFLWALSSFVPKFATYFSWIVALEAIVIGVEAIVLLSLIEASLIFCVLLSFLANSASTLFGLWLWRFVL